MTVRNLLCASALLFVALPCAGQAPTEYESARVAKDVQGIHQALDRLVGLLESVQRQQSLELLLKRIEMHERRQAPLERRLRSAENDVDNLQDETKQLDLMWAHIVQVRCWKALRRPVICDRHLLDSLVDFRVYFPDDRVEDRWLCRLLCALAVRPDAAFCLLVPAEESMRRTSNRGRHHWETREVLEQRLREYRALAIDLQVRILDGRQPVERIASILQDRVAEEFAASSGRAEPLASRLGDS